MQHCGSQYGVFIAGKWQWFSEYQQAARIEAEQLSGKVQKKRASGGTVILTKDMWKQMEAVAKDGATSPATNGAN